jgi:hypothetical protein
MLSYKNFSWVYKSRGQRPDGTYNCFYAAAVEVLINGGRLMRGPASGHEGETAHFWVERNGDIIDPTQEQYDR